MIAVVVVSVLGLSVIAGILGYHGYLVTGLSRHKDNRAPRLAEWPSITVVRPIKGLDPGAERNIEALYACRYDGPIRFLFVLDDDRDPAMPIVRSVMERHPEREAQLILAGEPPSNRTGKINKMIIAAEQTTTDIIAFCDSDTRPQPNILEDLVSLLWASPDHGIAFAPAVAVSDDALAGDSGYAILMNAWYGAAVSRIVGPGGEVPFAMGQFMLLRNSALQEIGGMRVAEGQLVDDMFLGTKMLEHGFKNVTGDQRIPVVIGGMRIRDFLKIFRKWIFFSQSGLPAAFTRAGWMRALAGFGAWGTVIAGLVLAMRHPEASPIDRYRVLLIGALAVEAFVFSQIRLSEMIGGAKVKPKHWWVAATLPFLAAGVAASTKFYREVGWRGRRYRLDASGRLRVVPAGGQLRQ